MPTSASMGPLWVLGAGLPRAGLGRVGDHWRLWQRAPPTAPARTLCGMCDLWSEVPWASRMAGLRSGGGRSGAQVEGEPRALRGRVTKGSPCPHPQMCQPELGSWLGQW